MRAQVEIRWSSNSDVSHLASLQIGQAVVTHAPRFVIDPCLHLCTSMRSTRRARLKCCSMRGGGVGPRRHRMLVPLGQDAILRSNQRPSQAVSKHLTSHRKPSKAIRMHSPRARVARSGCAAATSGGARRSAPETGSGGIRRLPKASEGIGRHPMSSDVVGWHRMASDGIRTCQEASACHLLALHLRAQRHQLRLGMQSSRNRHAIGMHLRAQRLHLRLGRRRRQSGARRRRLPRVLGEKRELRGEIGARSEGGSGRDRREAQREIQAEIG